MTSVSIASLSWQTPSNHTLLDNLNLTLGLGRTGLVGRNETGKSTLLRLIADELSPSRGSITGPTCISYQRQSADEVSATTVADLFGVTDQLRILSRAERGEATADDLTVADWTLEARLEAALTSLGLDQSTSRAESPCSCVSRSIVRMSCTVVRLACFRLGMVPPGLVQDRQNAVTAQAMTNRAHVSPELSGN